MGFNIGVPPEIRSGNTKEVQRLRNYLMKMHHAIAQAFEGVQGSGHEGSAKEKDRRAELAFAHSVKSMRVDNDTLTIVLQNGKTVNFRKPDAYGFICGCAGDGTISIGGYKLDSHGEAVLADQGMITLKLDVVQKKVMIEGSGFKEFEAGNIDVSAVYQAGWDAALETLNNG